jgi:hypothetical protein
MNCQNDGQCFAFTYRIICQISLQTDTSVFPFTLSTLHNYIGWTLARALAESQLLPLKVVKGLLYRCNMSEPKLDDASTPT